MRITDKIEEIEGYAQELSEILPENMEEYRDLKTRAACERYFEKIIGAVVDLSFLIIENMSLKIPEEDKESFDILSEKKIISKELAEKLKEAKGMRNIIAHEYGTIDDEIVFDSITQELGREVKEFIRQIKKIEELK
jgi:uncharacterized protein YutE (UPF0331/DUF86 family)